MYHPMSIMDFMIRHFYFIHIHSPRYIGGTTIRKLGFLYNSTKIDFLLFKRLFFYCLLYRLDEGYSWFPYLSNSTGILHDPLLCHKYIKEFQVYYKLCSPLCALPNGCGVTSCDANKVIKKRLTFFSIGNHWYFSSFQKHFQNIASYKEPLFPLRKLEKA